VPVNSGSRPGAPLGGHSTKVPAVPEEPVAVAAPAVDALPPRVPPPAEPAVPALPELAALVPLEPPPPAPPAEFDLPEVVVAPPIAVEPVTVVEFVGAAEEVVAVVPGTGVGVTDEFATLGGAIAPPEAGKPLRNAALPTLPLVGVADGATVCAAAGAASPSDTRTAKAALRIMAE